jgi:hypothetical protein
MNHLHWRMQTTTPTMILVVYVVVVDFAVEVDAVMLVTLVTDWWDQNRPNPTTPQTILGESCFDESSNRFHSLNHETMTKNDE